MDICSAVGDLHRHLIGWAPQGQCLGGTRHGGHHRAGAQVELDKMGATRMVPRWDFISLGLDPYIEWSWHIFRSN